MKVSTTMLAGVLIIEPRVFHDERGFFKETYSAQRYQEQAGITMPLVQDNCSRSSKNVLRGLHLQKTRPQGKLISVSYGAVLDVTVDINPYSPTYGQHVAIEISDVNHRQVWVPPGYAHGFCVISEQADLHYKCTDYYHPDDEAGLAWDCPTLAIPWPTSQPHLSEKDRHHPTLAQWQNLQP